MKIYHSWTYWSARNNLIKENIKAPRHWPLGPVNSPHKWPVTWKMSPFDDVIMGRPYTLQWLFVLNLIMITKKKSESSAFVVTGGFPHRRPVMRRVMLWRHHERHRRFSVDLRDCSTIMIRLTIDATRSVTYSMKTIYCILSPSISVFSPKILTPKMFWQVKQQVCSNICRNINIDWKLNICQVISNFLDTYRTPASSCR